MKPKIILLSIVSLITIHVFSQKEAADNSAAHKFIVDGYSVRITEGPGNTYGYAIWKDKTLLVREIRNPFTRSLNGLRKREDAVKVATWVVAHLLKNPSINSPNQVAAQILLRRGIPKKVAEQLHVDIN